MITPIVEIEEEIYPYVPADNGAFPLWCWGSTCIVRLSEDLFVSGLETLPGVKPLSNVRWLLFQRKADGWELQQRDEKWRTREPCPLGVFPDGRLWLFANPTLGQLPRGNPAMPQLLCFSAAAPQELYRVLLPEWEGGAAFTEHSYRGLAVDGPHCELLLLNISGYESYYWSFLDSEGRWSARGTLPFPWYGEYSVPLRLCYPVAALAKRAALIFAVSDIVEPVKEWREHKFALTQREWDYVFRRLYYAWTPDIVTTPFGGWVEIANWERTAGNVRNLDVWVAPDGAAHLLWWETSLDTRLRSKFFPDAVLTTALRHGMVRDGQLVAVQTLAQAQEGSSDAVPMWGRFHATPDGRLFVFYSAKIVAAVGGKGTYVNRLLALLPRDEAGQGAEVTLEHPFGIFFMTATERGGSPPSDTLDVLGWLSDVPAIRYARIRLA